jgi:hypothetical protein
MSITKIPERIKLLLWGKAGGRCEYEGCNELLWQDPLTKFEFNSAYIAHIIADKPMGPRGDPVLSKQLRFELSNLMLLCDRHHRLIDHEQVNEHSVERLSRMKEQHEHRIQFLTSLTENKHSHVLLYGANIGNHSSPVSWDRATPALLPDYYPAEKPAIELGMKNSSFVDNDPDYWQIERENLQKLFSNRVKPRLLAGDINHLSIFALAPQPLLMELGHLLSDIPAAQVYQLHREPPNWKWQESIDKVEYVVQKPANIDQKVVALILALSATITPDRITDVLGNSVAIWTFTITGPNNDFLKSHEHLSAFRKSFRTLMDTIKAEHGQNTLLHVFPAVPVSVAVEIGRVRMPKADLTLRIYDQNRSTGGFAVAFDIV